MLWKHPYPRILHIQVQVCWLLLFLYSHIPAQVQGLSLLDLLMVFIGFRHLLPVQIASKFHWDMSNSLLLCQHNPTENSSQLSLFFKEMALLKNSCYICHGESISFRLFFWKNVKSRWFEAIKIFLKAYSFLFWSSLPIQQASAKLFL